MDMTLRTLHTLVILFILAGCNYHADKCSIQLNWVNDWSAEILIHNNTDTDLLLYKSSRDNSPPVGLFILAVPIYDHLDRILPTKYKIDELWTPLYLESNAGGVDEYRVPPRQIVQNIVLVPDMLRGYEYVQADKKPRGFVIQLIFAPSVAIDQGENRLYVSSIRIVNQGPLFEVLLKSGYDPL